MNRAQFRDPVASIPGFRDAENRRDPGISGSRDFPKETLESAFLMITTCSYSKSHILQNAAKWVACNSNESPNISCIHHPGGLKFGVCQPFLNHGHTQNLSPIGQVVPEIWLIFNFLFSKIRKLAISL